MNRRVLPDLRNLRQQIGVQVANRADDASVGLRITNEASDPDVTELWLYNVIGGWSGIYAEDVLTALADVTTPNLRVRLNSPGGDVFEGIAIMNVLASFTGVVTGVVDALCASIATAIAMGCESITMSPGSQMMIHPASSLCWGDAADMAKMATLLDFQTANMAALYASKAGGTQDEWLALMRAETWYTADEAVTAGLADATGVVKQSAQSVTPTSPWESMWDSIAATYRYPSRDKAPAPAAASDFSPSNEAPEPAPEPEPTPPGDPADETTPSAIEAEATTDINSVIRESIRRVTAA